MMLKFVYIGALVAACVVAITPVAFVSTFVWPYAVLTRLELTVSEPVIAGEPMRVTVDYDKRRDWSPQRVEVSLQDGFSIGLPFDAVRLPVGHHATTILVPVPPRVPPGQYFVQVAVTYEPFPWKAVTYTARTRESVEVIR